ncbi:MAG: TIGR01458 family HAD-type hydrolase [Gammaproteobacteria bacterium]|nr:MAG: TIGR01458 family HAD-type hydrolase [Gammaproteobacteria bacterium]
MHARALLFDIDGVLHVGETPIPGAREVLDWCRDAGIPHLFLTNTTSRPRAAIAARLENLGLPVPESAILTPVEAARDWLRESGRHRVALFVPEATAREFGEFERVEGESGAQAVVLGDLGEAWDFHRLNRAFRLLMAGPDVALVALGMTRYWRAADGLRLDVGPFVAALAYATDRTPVVTGKPAAPFFHAALERLGTEPGETVMIGDDIRGDIGGAREAGLRALLVQTGKFRPQDLEGDLRPDGVLASVADLPRWWREHA